MLLSIILNVWEETDVFRFMLQLYSFIYYSKNLYNYYNLIKDSLDGWERGKYTCKRYHKLFSNYNFKQYGFNKSDVEIILAVDSKTKIPIVDEFNKWANKYLTHKQIIYGKYGISTLRNVAVKVCRGKYIIFRDDDDLSAPICRILNQCKELSKIGFGTNDLSYQKFIPAYTDVTELYNYFHYFQKKPTIAIFKDSIKLKNTISSAENPFAVTSTPIDTTNLELDNRASNLSMCGRIFSREAINLIYNTSICNGMEDARSNFLQQRIQHCIYIFKEDKLKQLKKSWNRFKCDEFDETIDNDMRYINLNILCYRNWRVHDLLNKENVNRLDFIFKEALISKASPFFVYVLPSGSYATNSWAWGTVIGALESIRCSGRHVDFTMNDLKHLKTVIEHGVKTTVLDTHARMKMNWIGKANGENVTEYLNYLARHEYIYWFAVTRDAYKYKILEYKLEELRKYLHMLPKHLPRNINADVVKTNLLHPNQLVKVIVNDKKIRLPNDNQTITSKIYFGNVNYTDVPKSNKSILISIIITILLILLI